MIICASESHAPILLLQVELGVGLVGDLVLVSLLKLSACDLASENEGNLAAWNTEASSDVLTSLAV
jgi:hypothetical protein